MQEHEVRGSRKRLRAFVIHRLPLIREALVRAINAEDIQVVGQAVDEFQAADALSALRPDVVLIESQPSPEADAECIRGLATALPGTQIIVIGTSVASDAATRAVLAGAHGYLTTEMSSAAVLRSVRALRRGHLAMPRAIAAATLRQLASIVHRGPTAVSAEWKLSPREGQVLELLAEGLTDREIARALGLSPRTVEKHVAAILRKTSAKRRQHAALQYRSATSVPRQGGYPEGQLGTSAGNSTDGEPLSDL